LNAGGLEEPTASDLGSKNTAEDSGETGVTCDVPGNVINLDDEAGSDEDSPQCHTPPLAADAAPSPEPKAPSAFVQPTAKTKACPKGGEGEKGSLKGDQVEKVAPKAKASSKKGSNPRPKAEAKAKAKAKAKATAKATAKASISRCKAKAKASPTPSAGSKAKPQPKKSTKKKGKKGKYSDLRKDPVWKKMHSVPRHMFSLPGLFFWGYMLIISFDMVT